MRWPWKKEETELDREIEHHLTELALQYEAEGLSRKEALRKARREFGATELIKDQCRDESRWHWLAELRQDLVFGGRMMRATPLVTAAAVVSLALGIGANTAIVSLMDVVLLRGLPVRAPEQLTMIHWTADKYPRGACEGGAGSMWPDGAKRVGNFFPYRFLAAANEAAKGQAEVAAYVAYAEEVSTSFRGRSAVAHERPVDGSLLRVIGVTPRLGRLIEPSDDVASATPVTVASHRFWLRELGGDPAVIGQTIRVNNRPRVLVGVLPADFYGMDLGDRTALYTPLRHASALLGNPFFDLQNQANWIVAMVARRAPGVTDAQLAPRWATVFPTVWAGQPKSAAETPAIRLDPGFQGQRGLRRDFEKPILVLAALVSLVLLIACANIANLLLARGEARAREIAVRLSLGCTRARLLRQLLTESAMLAALGGALSLGFAYATANLLARLAPGVDSQMFDVPLDLRMVLAAVAATVVTTLLFGLYPAWRASRTQLNGELKERTQRLGHLLVAAQVALTVVLVASAALFTRNLQNIMGIDAGFRTANLVMFSMNPGQLGYEGVKLANFYREMERRLEQLPGVEGAALSTVELLAGGGWWGNIKVKGATKPIDVGLNTISPGFLPALGVELRSGRLLREGDHAVTPLPAIVSEEVARQIGPAALGQRFTNGGETQEYEIVGIAANVHHHRLTEKTNVVYLPADGKSQTINALVRTATPPQAAMPMILGAMAELDRDVPVVNIRSMDDQVSVLHKRERLFAYLCGGFGILALALSAVGLYGVMSYSATRRQQEIGVRMALGATPGRIVSMVLRDGLAWVAVGLLAGAPFVYWGAEYVKKELHEMEPFDPVALGSGAAVLLTAALFASWWPAWRASRLSPQVALRRE